MPNSENIPTINRREFLKNTVAVSVVSFLPGLTLAQTEEVLDREGIQGTHSVSFYLQNPSMREGELTTFTVEVDFEQKRPFFVLESESNVGLMFLQGGGVQEVLYKNDDTFETINGTLELDHNGKYYFSPNK